MHFPWKYFDPLFIPNLKNSSQVVQYRKSECSTNLKPVSCIQLCLHRLHGCRSLFPSLWTLPAQCDISSIFLGVSSSFTLIRKTGRSYWDVESYIHMSLQKQLTNMKLINHYNNYHSNHTSLKRLKSNRIMIIL